MSLNVDSPHGIVTPAGIFKQDTQIMNIRLNEMRCLFNVMYSDWSHALKESVCVP